MAASLVVEHNIPDAAMADGSEIVAHRASWAADFAAARGRAREELLVVYECFEVVERPTAHA